MSVNPRYMNTCLILNLFKIKCREKKINSPVTEFKEFERQFKFKPRLKYGWFHLKLYQMFQDLSRRLI